MASKGEKKLKADAAMRVPNNPAAGKAGIARLLAIEHDCPGLPKPGRSAT
jgi:hypothetical protein